MKDFNHPETRQEWAAHHRNRDLETKRRDFVQKVAKLLDFYHSDPEANTLSEEEYELYRRIACNGWLVGSNFHPKKTYITTASKPAPPGANDPPPWAISELWELESNLDFQDRFFRAFEQAEEALMRGRGGEEYEEAVRMWHQYIERLEHYNAIVDELVTELERLREKERVHGR